MNGETTEGGENVCHNVGGDGDVYYCGAVIFDDLSVSVSYR